MMVFIVLLGVLAGFFYGYFEGQKDKESEILKKNPDYFLTEDLKIEKIWCVPE
jgi:uncharacterized protein YneF (UPF0154 family)